MLKRTEAETTSYNVNAEIAEKARRKGIRTSIYGYVMIFCCAPIAVAGFSKIDNPSEIVYSSIFLALTIWGIALVVRGNRARKLAELYPTYFAHIAQSSNGSIQEAADSMGEEADDFRENVSAMTKHGLFSGYIYNVKDDCIKNMYFFSTPKTEDKFTAVRCTGCGASGKVSPGNVAKCRYCGTYLSAVNTTDKRRSRSDRSGRKKR